MDDYGVPIIPNINFNKNEKGNYIFNADSGMVYVRDISYNISNINVVVSNNIEVFFKLEKKYYDEIFLDKIDDEIYEISIISMDIECESNGFNLHISNCYKYEQEFQDGFYFIWLTADKINCYKNNFISSTSLVKIWKIIGTNDIYHTSLKKFNSKNLNGIYLKSKYFVNENISKEVFNQQQEGFNQLMGENSLLYYKTDYKHRCSDAINNIGHLLEFYDPSSPPFTTTIIEDEYENLEIVIYSYEKTHYQNTSIFSESPFNFFNYINSTYDNYLKIKNGEIDIDLLLEYYVLIKNQPYFDVKIILFSIFIEILKNNKLNPDENLLGLFNKKISNRLSQIALNKVKLFKYSFPRIYNGLDKLNEENFNGKYCIEDINIVINLFKDNYVIALVEFFRNKSIHGGTFEWSNDKKEDFSKKLELMFKNDLSPIQQQLSGDINGIIKNLLSPPDSTDYFEIIQFIDFLIDIIILSLLQVDCQLADYPIFNSILIDKPFNSNELIEKFRDNNNINFFSKFKNIINFLLKLLKLH